MNRRLIQGSEKMAQDHLVTLTAGRLTLDLNPATGGSISALRWDGEWPVMRAPSGADDDVLDAASFPLVPFVNRIRGGCFTVRGREVRLAPNMAGDPSPLHGQGWLGAWTVEEASYTRAVLTFSHAAGEWPWSYDARQEIALDAGGLSLRLTCRNRSADPMPCGLGQHPYFPCGPETRIDTSVASVWTIDEHVLPVEEQPAAGRFDLSDRLVCGQGLDHGFGGWSGEARLSDPVWPYDLSLSSPQAKFFQLYSPDDGGIFVAEPATHANAALNAPESDWPALGMQVLEPGAEMGLDMRLDVAPKGAG
jgi:aldose 1-epimerase